IRDFHVTGVQTCALPISGAQSWPSASPAECFIGSVWNLPNNGNGSITFDADGQLCAPGAVRNIVWSIHNPGKEMGEPQFQFKKRSEERRVGKECILW